MMTKRTILLSLLFLYFGMKEMAAIPKVISIVQSDDLVYLRLRNPGHELFRYRLNEGSDWIQSTSSEIYLTKIPAGSHLFVLTGISNPGERYSTTINVSGSGRKAVLVLIFCTGILFLLLGHSVLTKLRINREYKNTAGSQKYLMTGQRLPLSQIFHGLQLLRKYIPEKDKKQSSRFLSKTSLLMRMLLESGTKKDNPLDKELEIINIQFELKKLAMGSSFYFSIEKYPGCRCEELTVPALLLEQIVSGSLAFDTESGSPETVHFVIIEISAGKNEVVIRVNDNTPYPGIVKSYDTETQLKIFAEKSKTRTLFKVFYGRSLNGFQMGRSVEMRVYQGIQH